MPRDRRSVGELLLEVDTAARTLLYDVEPDDAPALVAGFGEIVQAAADLWADLPKATSPSAQERAVDAVMTTLTIAAERILGRAV